jgi:exosortase/archaeosortase
VGIYIPGSVKVLGESAFDECSELTKIEFSSSLKKLDIQGNPFAGCSSLNGVYITDVAAWCDVEFENADDNPLYYVRNLYLNGKLVTDLTIPYGVTTINQYAFVNSSIYTVWIPETVSNIGRDAFSGCGWLEKVYVDDMTAWCNISFENDTSNPLYYANELWLYDHLDTSGTVKTRVYKEVNDLVIPSGITTLKSYAFINCMSLTSVEIPATVTSISDSVFSGCTEIKSISMLGGLTRIGANTFSGCTGLTDVTIPSSVTCIEYGAFNNCTRLTGVHISDVAAWCNIVFEYRYYDDTNPLSIAHNLYLGDELIENLVIPDGVTVIKQNAFRGCTSIKSVTIPSSVTEIKTYAFSGCTGLNDVYISSMESWLSMTCDSNPLNYASNLYLNGELVTDLSSLEGITSIRSSAFYTCKSLENANIPESVTSIGRYAFAGSGITTATIPDGITRIDEGLFSNCSSLTRVTIPSSIRYIEMKAFAYCTSLTNVIYEGTMEEWESITKSSSDWWDGSHYVSGWDYDTGDYIITCTDGTINKTIEASTAG